MEEGEFIYKGLNTVQEIITDVIIAPKYLYKDTGKGCTGVFLSCSAWKEKSHQNSTGISLQKLNSWGELKSRLQVLRPFSFPCGFPISWRDKVLGQE